MGVASHRGEHVGTAGPVVTGHRVEVEAGRGLYRLRCSTCRAVGEWRFNRTAAQSDADQHRAEHR